MTLEIPSKIPNIGTSIFAVMTKLANEHDAINLSQGFPDFDCSDDLKALVAKHLRRGENQYAPMPGVPALRRQIVQKIRDLYQADYDVDQEITVTAGATAALFTAITAVVQKGDEAILVEPAYDSYLPTVLLSGGVPVITKLRFPDYSIDWDEVRDLISPRTKLIILNTPHNPSGAVLTKNDFQALKEIVRDTNIVIISDEVYEHIVFDDLQHVSIASDDELRQRSFVISSFGKTYHTTGWKIGYCTAPAALTDEFRRVHQFLTYAVNTPIQHAYAEFMADSETYLGLSAFYQEKRDVFLSKIANSRFKVIPCEGAYFQMLDYSAITDAPDHDFANELTIRHGVAAIPPSVFYSERDDHKVLRFCFAKKNETLARAGELLSKL